MQLSQLSIPEIGIGATLTGSIAGVKDQVSLTSDAFAPIIDNKLQLTQPSSESTELNIKMLLDTPEVAKQIKTLLLSNGQSGAELAIPKDVLTNLLSLSKAGSSLATETSSLEMVALDTSEIKTNLDTANLIDTFKQQLQEKLETKFSDVLSKEDIEKIISEVTSDLTENIEPSITNQSDNVDIQVDKAQVNFQITNQNFLRNNLELTNSLFGNIQAKVSDIKDDISVDIPKTTDQNVELNIDVPKPIDQNVELNTDTSIQINQGLIIQDQLQAVKKIIDSNSNTEIPVSNKVNDKTDTELIEAISSSLMPIINNSMVEKLSIIKTESNSIIVQVKEKSGKTDSIMLNQICSGKQNNTPQTGTIILNALKETIKKTSELSINQSQELPKIEVSQKLLQDSIFQNQESNENPIQMLTSSTQPELNIEKIISTESKTPIKLDEVVTKMVELVEKQIDLSEIKTSNKKLSASELEKIIVSIKEEIHPVMKFIKKLPTEDNLVIKISKEPNIQKNILSEIPLKSINSLDKNNSTNSISFDSQFSENSQKNLLSRIDRSININKINIDNIDNSFLSNSKKTELVSNFAKENILGEGIKKQEKFKFDFVSFNNNGNSISNFLLSSSIDPLNSTNRIMNSNIEINNRTSITNTNIVDQVLEKMKFNSGKTELSIQLNPYDLGKVDVSVSLQRGSVVAHMVAETAKAAESLKSGMDNLKQSLSESGINVDKIVITSADKSSFSGNNNESNPNNSKDNWLLNQNSNNNNNHQQEKQNFKDSFDLSNSKNNSDSRERANNSKGNTENTSTKQDDFNLSNNAKEENFINSDKGIVNYRV